MQQVAEPELLLVMALAGARKILTPVVGVDCLIRVLPQAESVQVAVGPAEAELEHGVELGQLDRGRNEQAAPNGRLNVEQGDLQLHLDSGRIELGAGFNHGGKEVARRLQVYLPHRSEEHTAELQSLRHLVW